MKAPLQPTQRPDLIEYKCSFEKISFELNMFAEFLQNCRYKLFRSYSETKNSLKRAPTALDFNQLLTYPHEAECNPSNPYQIVHP